MREIQLKGRQYTATQRTIDALAWATLRRGRNTWKDAINVVLPVISYLEAHNVDVKTDYLGHGTGSNLRYVMKKLVDEGFAEVTQTAKGKPYTTFRFLDDVDLTGHMPVFRRMQEPVAMADHPVTTTPPLTHSPVIDMPLPPAPTPERYMQGNVNAALDVWAERDAEGYAKWAETLIERLGALYG